MSDIPTRENRAAEAKRLWLRADGMEPIGWIFIDPETNRRATLDYFGRVQRWDVDGSGRMHAESARVAELEAERADLQAERDAAWERIGELEAEVKVDDELLNYRNRLLNEIPACPAHGSSCIPHAIAWVNDAKDLMGMNGDEIEQVQDALDGIPRESSEAE